MKELPMLTEPQRQLGFQLSLGFRCRPLLNPSSAAILHGVPHAPEAEWSEHCPGYISLPCISWVVLFKPSAVTGPCFGKGSGSIPFLHKKMGRSAGPQWPLGANWCKYPELGCWLLKSHVSRPPAALPVTGLFTYGHQSYHE